MSKSSFEELLASLEAAQDEQALLTKSIAAGDDDDNDDDIAAAAGDDDGDEDGDDDGEGQMTKSVMIGDEEFFVMDPDEMFKSISGLTARVDATETNMTKALNTAVTMLKGQGDMIKSLSEQIQRISSTGAGRKSQLSVIDKPGSTTMAKSLDNPGVTTGEFMAKATAKFEARQLTGQELTVIDVSIRQNQPIDQGLIAKVLS